ncbi:MAG: glycosyltransferase [Alphaproteobacteria bacterium]|nr:glycosyltransferase [Alphaproteobacteria bacterium]
MKTSEADSNKDMPHQNNNRKNIVFVLPALNAGGAERVLITLMNGLDPQRFNRYMISVCDGGPLRDLIKEEIPFYALCNNKSVGKSLFRLYRKLKALRPDIVISTMAHMNYGVLLLKPFFPHTKFIVREAVTPSYFMNRGRIQTTLIKSAYRLLYPQAEYVISPAQKIIDEFPTILNMSIKNHILLPNPVDIDKIRAVQIAAVNPERVDFVCAGRLDVQKGFDRLIAALPQLATTYEWHLTILGEGPERDNLTRQIKEMSLESHVSLPGHSNQPWAVIAAADAFLMPSRWEGLPNAALESLACGTPVIATHESGGIGEIAKYTKGSDLQVVTGMDSFISAMDKIVPSQHKTARPSLLPDNFHRDNVQRRFVDIISGL